MISRKAAKRARKTRKRRIPPVWLRPAGNAAFIRVHSRPKESPRHGEQGFALLFIFVLLAGIAIGMLMQLPRVAFETQREREEMLIERGEQYQRAIGLYVKQMKRYPQKIEDLESTNNMRFLRRRYIDPMTGKDDWRMIHVGPGGQLLDSLVKKAPQNPLSKDGKSADGKDSQNAQNSMNADPSNTVGTNNAPPEVNQAVRARPSDQVGMAGIVNPPNPYGYPQPPQAPGQPVYSQTVPMAGQPGQPYVAGQPVYTQPLPPGYNPNSGQPGQLPPSIMPGQQPGYPMPQPMQPGSVQPGQQPYPQQMPYPQGQAVLPGQVPLPQPVQGAYPQPGQPVYQPQPGQPYNPMQNMPGVITPPQGQVMQPGLPQYQQIPQPQQPPQPQPPRGGMLPTGSTPQGQATAQQMIQNILMNPRQPPASASAFNNQGFGGGIAGIATKYKSPSIKIYNERQKYQEWEFVYDPKKDPVLNPSIATGGAPPGSTSSPTGSSLGSSSSSSSSSSTGFSGSSSGSFSSTNGLSPATPQTSPGLGGR